MPNTPSSNIPLGGMASNRNEIDRVDVNGLKDGSQDTALAELKGRLAVVNAPLAETSLASPTDRLLRLNQVIAPIGPVPVSKSTWWLWTRTGYAPPPVRISKRITTWRESEIRAFVARHSAQREG